MTAPFDPAMTFALADIGRAIGMKSDTLRKWFDDGEDGGGLLLFPDAGDVPSAGGKSHRLHWRTAAGLLLAVKLNEYGLRLRGGEAAQVVGAIFAAGLDLPHLSQDEARPLIMVQRANSGTAYVLLIGRATLAGYVENVPTAGQDEGPPFGNIGSILIDPASIGRVLADLAQSTVTA